MTVESCINDENYKLEEAKGRTGKAKVFNPRRLRYADSYSSKREGLRKSCTIITRESEENRGEVVRKESALMS